ncbi:MAG: RdgB/HAM1 family non-canonical purine NTP pyrophosphatase [Angelakisella sp.]|jgi:XTP/dITP diphosphohydrolase|uniref:RdgB/HAM1 family non-canonical purine NTP pyrophosphatase n=1 Tax=Angelakisella sp. TaxID=1935177 RepID=UPI0015A5BF1E|nr:RdgB/HAM1 family non-canonical purine NTP pyrophosphatase [Angelakisella sp.]
MKLILATKNEHKVEEFQRILAPLGWQVIPQDAVCPPDLDIEETGKTFAENAYLKAMGIYRATGLPTVADDSGLCVDALNGAPGVYSARYAGEGHDSAANNAKLLREMEKIPDERRAARFVCAICAVFGEVDIVRCEGACEGTIARRLHGQNGFGYDPLFMVGERSFAELDGPAKDAISHRGRALAALYEKLKDRKEGE